MDDFIELDRVVRENFNEDNLNDLSKNFNKTEELINRGFFLKGLEDIVLSLISINDNEKKNQVKTKFEKVIEEAVLEVANNDEFDFKDCIVEFRRPKTGFEKTPYLYNYKKNEVVNFRDISKIDNEIRSNQSFFPLFFIYVIKNSDINSDYKEKFLKDVGLEIAKKLNSGIYEIISLIE